MSFQTSNHTESFMNFGTILLFATLRDMEYHGKQYVCPNSLLFAIHVRRKSRKPRGCPDNLYGLVGIFPKRGEENENLPSKSFFLPLPLDLKEAFLSNMSLKYYTCHFKSQITL